MKVLARALALLVVFAASATATATAPAPATGDPAIDEGEPRRGCCSHHGGVCGCGGDTLRCCDGTDSPTCEC